jgi:hypothetical protein
MHLTWIVVLATTLLPPVHAGTEDPTGTSLSRLFPDGRLGRLQVAEGQAIWDSRIGTTLRSLLEQQGHLVELEKVRAGVTLATGADPAELLRIALAGELELGLYPARGGGSGRARRLLLAAKASDADALTRGLQAVLAAVAADEANQVEWETWRGDAYAWVNRRVAAAARHDTLLVATDVRLLKGALDRFDEPVTPPTQRPPGTLLEFELDTAVMRPSDKRLLPTNPLELSRRLVNPLANLLFGGLALSEGMLRGSLRELDGALTLRVGLPTLPEQAPAAYLPPEEPAEISVPVSDHTIGVLFVRRDLSDWWRQREALMPEKSQAGLAKLDQTLSVLFGGLSPAEDVFGGVGADLAMVFDRLDLSDAAALPEVRLPGACLVGRIDDPTSFTPSIQVAFQTLLGVINADRARDQRAPFLLETLDHRGVRVTMARLLPGAGSGGDGEPAAIDFNLSPAVAVVGDRLLLGTAGEQVLRLVDSLVDRRQSAYRANSQLSVDGHGVAQLLDENHRTLVAKAILEDGLTPEQAEERVETLVDLAGLIETFAATLERSAQGLELVVELALREQGP